MLLRVLNKNQIQRNNKLNYNFKDKLMNRNKLLLIKYKSYYKIQIHILDQYLKKELNKNEYNYLWIKLILLKRNYQTLLRKHHNMLNNNILLNLIITYQMLNLIQNK